MNKEELKENWLKIVDLIANAKGIVDLVDAEQIFLKALQFQNQDLLKEIEEDLKNGKFYQICSNETTFKNYIKKLL